jgi:hypothetical protein
VPHCVVVSTLAKHKIGSAMFDVPSIFLTGVSFIGFLVWTCFSFTNLSPMKRVDAPQSTNAFMSAFLNILELAKPYLLATLP